eukprot:12795539-Alexandrium_andersonii.AAC.1
MPRRIPASAGPPAHLEAPPRARVPAPRGGRSGHPRRTAVRSPRGLQRPRASPTSRGCRATPGLKCRDPVFRRGSRAWIAKLPSPAQRHSSIAEASERQCNSRGGARNPG